MDNELDQSKVAYETDGPKEVTDNKGMPSPQFTGNKMPQSNKMQKRKGHGKVSHVNRHKEHR